MIQAVLPKQRFVAPWSAREIRRVRIESIKSKVRAGLYYVPVAGVVRSMLRIIEVGVSNPQKR